MHVTMIQQFILMEKKIKKHNSLCSLNHIYTIYGFSLHYTLCVVQLLSKTISHLK